MEKIDILYLSSIADQYARTADFIVDNGKIGGSLIVIYHLYLEAFEKKLKTIFATNTIIRGEEISKKILKDLGHDIFEVNLKLSLNQQIKDIYVLKFIKNNQVELRYGGYPFVPYAPETIEKLKLEYQRLVTVLCDLSRHEKYSNY